MATLPLSRYQQNVLFPFLLSCIARVFSFMLEVLPPVLTHFDKCVGCEIALFLVTLSCSRACTNMQVLLCALATCSVSVLHRRME
jgi:hypothetical protein